MSEEQNIPEMRKTIERLSKEKSTLEAQVGDLQSQVRVGEAKEAFRAAGYNPKHGELFALANPEGEVTVEAAAAFAEEQGLPALVSTQEASVGSEDSTAEEDGTGDLSAMSGSGSRTGGSGAGGAAPESLTRQEWQDLYASDPEAGRQAIASGRVEISKGNPFVKGVGAPRGTNPYAAAIATD